MALTETLLLKNLFTVLELNVFSKIHKTAVNSAALAALHNANNIVTGLKRKINNNPTKRMRRLPSCLDRWDTFRYITFG